MKGKDYLITDDYFSQFFELDYLPDTSADTVVDKMKQHFARHGVPDVVVSDNGGQYVSAEFARFSCEWGFAHEPISPGHSESNGAAEAAVKSAKYLIKKSQAAKEDPMIGLLNLRNTPQEGLTTSPLQRLFGRRTKTLIPCANCILTPAVAQIIHGERVRMEDKKAAVAERYTDRRELPPLQVGDTVRMQPITRDKEEWQEATVSKTLKNRSYEVTTGTGRTYRGSRVFLRSSCPSTHDK